MGVFSELDLENQQAELDGHDSKAAEMQTLQAKLIQQHEQKKVAANKKNEAAKPELSSDTAKSTEQDDAAAVEAEKRRQHEEAEAKRKAEWERQQEEKRAAEQATLAKIEQMSETELVKASMERMKKETERLTRRNLKECVSEYVQTLCLSDPAFARMVMHPRKSMAHCLQYINRKAREYLLAEMKDNGTLGGKQRRIHKMWPLLPYRLLTSVIFAPLVKQQFLFFQGQTPCSTVSEKRKRKTLKNPIRFPAHFGAVPASRRTGHDP